MPTRREWALSTITTALGRAPTNTELLLITQWLKRRYITLVNAAVTKPERDDLEAVQQAFLILNGEMRQWFENQSWPIANLPVKLPPGVTTS